MAKRAEEAPRELWVFGYGSLVWRPGFVFAERHKALLRGWRRRLCVYSHVYRGTADRPGLVLGLDRGGACHGVAFRVEAALREATVRYLRDRELVTAVYLARRSVARRVGAGGGEVVERRAAFGRRRSEKMEMELHRFGDVAERAPGAGEDGLGKDAGVGERQQATPTVRVDGGGDQHGVAIGRAGVGVVDGNDVATPGRPPPGTKARLENLAGEGRERFAVGFGEARRRRRRGFGPGLALGRGRLGGPGRNGVSERQHRTISRRRG